MNTETISKEEVTKTVINPADTVAPFVYQFFASGRNGFVRGNTSFGAQKTAAAHLRVPPKRSHQVSVILAYRENPDGTFSQVSHSTAAL